MNRAKLLLGTPIRAYQSSGYCLTYSWRIEMAELKLGEPFGLDAKLLGNIDWTLALDRIMYDLKTDFIYAPHLAFIYRNTGDKLISDVKGALESGKFNVGVPLTIEVPKSFRIQVPVPSKRLGPNFSRPGSILLPPDRLFYQVLADRAAPIVQQKTDSSRSFSHKLAATNAPTMFLPARTCWAALQKSLKTHAAKKKVQYILKLDVANYFSSVNIHTLANSLQDSGYAKSLAERLEITLIRFTNERSSRGILQGIFPSDLFGNFYMASVDRFLKEKEIPSSRYVDDIYVFIETIADAQKLVGALIPFLRSYDLVLNESKCKIIPKGSLITEEPDLQELFDNAMAEISAQVTDDEFDVDYGFQSEWVDEKESEEEPASLELIATKQLFDSIDDFPGQEENIERFCLPLFAKADSDYAIDQVSKIFKLRPALSQIYVAYLSTFIQSRSNIFSFFVTLLADVTLFDWQKMWVLAGLLQYKPPSDSGIMRASQLLHDATHHDALRAVAAIYIGRFGDLGRRKELLTIYPNVSNYVQAAIYYASRYWKGVESSNAKATWSGHGPLNALVSAALSKKSDATSP